MSGLNRYCVWINHFSTSPRGFCLCCRKVELDIADSHDVWYAGYIIHGSRFPDPKENVPNIYENVRPICAACNYNGKKFASSYHYMVSIGTMKASEVEGALAKIKKAVVDHKLHREIYKCGAPTKSKSTGKEGKCEHVRLPNLEQCLKHCSIEVVTPTKEEEILAAVIHNMIAMRTCQVFDDDARAKIDETFALIMSKRKELARERSTVKEKKEKPKKGQVDNEKTWVREDKRLVSIENSNNEKPPPRRSARLAEKEARRKAQEADQTESDSEE